MSVAHRLSLYIDYKFGSVSSFERSLSFSNGSIASQINNNKSIGSDRLEKILNSNPELSAEWLLTGNGDMIKSNQPTIQQLYHPKSTELIQEEQTVNLYDFEASAGLRTLFDNGRANVIDTIRIPNLPKCDGAIHIVGDSMYPLLKSGDIVLYKEINLDVRNIYWGETYLLSYYEDEEDVAVVIKYVQRSEEPGCIKLVSHNAHHAPRDIEFSKINAMAIVKASIRINSMY